MKRIAILFMIMLMLLTNTVCVFAETDRLVLSNELKDLSSVTVIKGFKTTNSWNNCGTEIRHVFCADGSGESYVVYDTVEIGNVSRAEFEVTVTNSNWDKIERTAESAKYLYLSHNGNDYIQAASMSAFNCGVSKKSAQNGHITYIVSYTFPSGYEYIKFDASIFADWQFYMTGVRLYGVKTDTLPKPVPNGYVSMGDAFETLSLDKTESNSGFTIQRWIQAKTGSSYVKAAAVKTVGKDTEAHLEYKAKSGDFCFVSANITVESFKNAWLMTDYGRSVIYVSENGTEYTAAENLKIEYEKENYDGALSYSTYKLYGSLPQGTRYLKIEATEFESWNFIVNEVLLYSEYTENEYNWSESPSIAKVHSDDFHTAIAVEPSELYDYNDVLLSQFDEITIENQMKVNVIHPSENTYNFEGTDRIVEFAQQHGMRVRGHGLVYEKTFPDWFFKNDDGSTASKELVMQRLENHVRTIVRRYKGKIYCYDVVNENFGHNGWDTRTLSQICGTDEYTRKVFEWAHEEDPDAILILNDNYYDIAKKRNNIYNYVKKLYDDGVPIHGIGFQDHMFIDTDLQSVEDTLTLFETIPNFKLFVTELDVQAYGAVDNNKVYPDFMNEELKAAVAKKYASLFDIYRKHSDRIETLGLWCISDKVSWLETGEKQYFATLVDKDKNPNPAYFAVLDKEGKLPRWDGGSMPPILRNNNYSIDEKTDVLTLTGDCSGNVEARLYSNYGEKTKVAEKALTANGAYEIKITIDTDEAYIGTKSPDYILEVCENENVKTDKFTYFTKAQREKYYTVTDYMEDYSKMYRAQNTMQTDGGVTAKVIWNNASLGDGSVVYKCPDIFILREFSLEMHKTSGDYYKVYLSPDDKEYTEAEVEWSESGNGVYKGNVKAIPEDMRFVKIALGTDKTKYLSYAEMHTKKAGGVETLAKLNMSSEDGILRKEGFSLVDWAYKRCGYDEWRNVFVNTDKNSYLMFDADDKFYTSAEFDVTVHNNANYRVSEQDFLNRMILVSDDGEAWRKSENVRAEQIGEPIMSDGNNYYTYKISCDIENGAKYLKVVGFDSGNECYMLFVHGAKFFGMKKFEMISQPKAVVKNGVINVTGAFSAIIPKSGAVGILASFGENGLLECDIQHFENSLDLKQIDISAKLPENAKHMSLYIWSGNMIPLSETINIKN